MSSIAKRASGVLNYILEIKKRDFMNKTIFAAASLLFGGIFYHAHAVSWFANEMCHNQAGLTGNANDQCIACVDRNDPNFVLEGGREGATGKISYQELAKTCIACSNFLDIRHNDSYYWGCINRCRPAVSPKPGEPLGSATAKKITYPYVYQCANCCSGIPTTEPLNWNNQSCQNSCQNACENMCGETSDSSCVGDCQQQCTTQSTWFAKTFTQDPAQAATSYARCSGQITTIMATLKQLREKLDDYNDEAISANLTVAGLEARLKNVVNKSSLVVTALQQAVTQCQNT